MLWIVLSNALFFFCAFTDCHHKSSYVATPSIHTRFIASHSLEKETGMRRFMGVP